MKILDPNSGLRQISTGKLYIHRRLILELIRTRKISVNELGYLLVALISTDWNEGDYRYGYIRHEIQSLARLWNIPYSTLNGNLKRLTNKGILIKNQGALFVNDFDFFQKAHAYKDIKLTDENLKQLFDNSLPNNDISESNHENSCSNSNKTPKVLNVPIKVVINSNNNTEANTRTLSDYQKIYKEGGYTTFLPEDMMWLDRHYDAEGKYIP